MANAALKLRETDAELAARLNLGEVCRWQRTSLRANPGALLRVLVEHLLVLALELLVLEEQPLVLSGQRLVFLLHLRVVFGDRLLVCRAVLLFQLGVRRDQRAVLGRTERNTNRETESRSW